MRSGGTVIMYLPFAIMLSENRISVKVRLTNLIEQLLVAQHYTTKIII